MSEQLLTILKLCLLALLYLFFFRVLRAVWAELRQSSVPTPAPVAARAGHGSPPPAAAVPPSRSRRRDKGRVGQLVVADPPERRGSSFALGDELTVGRAAGCAIAIPNDTYVSSLHARVFRAGDGSVQVEDLGSTNGTFVNRTKVGAPVTLAVGDRLQIGNTVFEVKG
jgi:pSer/pThr/pTyr-binding forkhead associated (FHA) protein